MNVLFLGSKDRGVACLDALIDAGITVCAVVAESNEDPDAFWEASVAEAATRHDLPLITPTNINDPDVIDKLSEYHPDLAVLCGFSQILKEHVLSLPEEGVINLHAGKLPDYRGGSPMNWTIINGEPEGTATIHYATERVDAGPILAEEKFDIDLEEDIEDVRQKTLEIFPKMLIRVIRDIEAGVETTRPNDPSEGVYYGSRLPEDGRIHWDRLTAREVYDFVRALTHPYPGAFTTYGDKRLYVWEASLITDQVHHHPGRICMRRGTGRVVSARDTGVLVKRVQPAGGDTHPASDYLERGEYLG